MAEASHMITFNHTITKYKTDWHWLLSVLSGAWWRVHWAMNWSKSSVSRKGENACITVLAVLCSCLRNPILLLTSDDTRIGWYMSIGVALVMGTLPRQTGKFSQMSLWLGESQLLDICVPSARVVTPCKLNLDSEAQVVNPMLVLYISH